MTKQATLGKASRLKSRKSIERLFREGKSFFSGSCKVYYYLLPLATPAGGAIPTTVTPQAVQAAFGVSARHFKKAVDRNRVKRVFREAYRLRIPVLTPLLLSNHRRLEVFFLYLGKERPDFLQASSSMENALVQLEKILHETPATYS